MNDPAHRASPHVLISRLSASGQWDRLREAALEWLEREPENGYAHRCAAQALVNLNRRAEAQTHLSKALASRPDDSFAHRLAAIVQFDLKKFADADRSIQAAIALNPEDGLNWYQLAWMCHQQKDQKNALKWITKARELDPTNPTIVNLYALCAKDAGERLEILRDALAADPESAVLHNNVGVQYLRKGQEIHRAEQFFRQAIALDPTLKVAKQNLLLVLRRHDLVYRILSAPVIFIQKVFGGPRSERNIGGRVAMVIMWFMLGRFFLAGLVLWLGLVWPLMKFYEFLVIGDTLKKAGEVGATRGGFLGYRAWSLKARMSLFAVVLVIFWGFVGYIIWGPPTFRAKIEEHQAPLAFAVAIALIIGGMFVGIRLYRRAKTKFHAWSRHLRLRKLGVPRP